MWQLNELVAHEHANDLLREAQHDRDIRAARGARGRSNGLYRSAMVWLGHWLVGWRLRLQARRSTIPFREDTCAAHRLRR